MTLPLLLKVFYLSMAVTVISLMCFYVYGLTSARRVVAPKAKTLFYSWIGLLIVSAVAFHILTAWKVPWVHWEVDRHNIQPDREIAVSVGKHQFNLPESGINVLAGEVVKFAVTSDDLTYGFGVFRRDGTMEFQMQVVPGHSNEIIWIFSDPGKYAIRSTEYAGVDTRKMYLPDAIEVSTGSRNNVALTSK